MNKPSPSVAQSARATHQLLSTSYASHMRKQPFDWNRFLVRKQYRATELEAAVKRAGKWVSCACGQQCVIIDRYCSEDSFGYGYHSKGEPKDEKLSDLGTQFYNNITQIKYNHIDGLSITKAQRTARATLGKIEKRAAILIKAKLKEMVKKAEST